jgi:hypothetical protein
MVFIRGQGILTVREERELDVEPDSVLIAWAANDVVMGREEDDYRQTLSGKMPSLLGCLTFFMRAKFRI